MSGLWKNVLMLLSLSLLPSETAGSYNSFCLPASVVGWLVGWLGELD